MNKHELICAISDKAGITKKDAGAALDALTVAITEALEKGDKVQLTGFGTFEVKTRGAKTGRNPQTGATINIPASKHPAFSASKVLKDSVNK